MTDHIFDSQAQVDRLIYLVQNEINSLTGQLVIATRNSGTKLSGSKRARVEKALTALPQQIASMESAKAILSVQRRAMN